jgi:ABC-type multidrug transport system permease subunit
MLVSVDKLPDWAQWLSRVTPLYYANNILQQLVNNRPVWDEWGSIIGLVGYGLLIFAFANLTLKEQD